MLEDQKCRKDWLRREEEQLKAEQDAYNLVLFEEKNIVVHERQKLELQEREAREQCVELERDKDCASRKFSELIYHENEVMDLKTGVLSEEKKLAA